MLRKVLGFFIGALMCFVFTGCAANSAKDEGPHYMDSEFIQSLGKGLEARWTLTDKVSDSQKSTANYQKYVQAELDKVEQYQSAQFEDSKLQEYAVSYINVLKDSMDAAGLYDSDKSGFSNKWDPLYDKRTELINIFVNDYGLTVSADKQDSLNKLISNGKAVTRESDMKTATDGLASSIAIEFGINYSHLEGTATAKNNTGYDFEYISFNVELYDESGVKYKTGNMSAQHWMNGETIVLDCHTDTDKMPTNVKVVTDSYSLIK